MGVLPATHLAIELAVEVVSMPDGIGERWPMTGVWNVMECAFRFPEYPPSSSPTSQQPRDFPKISV